VLELECSEINLSHNFLSICSFEVISSAMDPPAPGEGKFMVGEAERNYINTHISET
jgi:hypothetical protein